MCTPLAYPVPLPRSLKIGWYFDTTLVVFYVLVIASSQHNHCLFRAVSLFIQNRFLVYLEPFPCSVRAVSLFIYIRVLVYLEPLYCAYSLWCVGAPGVRAPLAYPVPPPTIIEDWMVL